jgi:NifB/MoaA-like Fe-S oxidoreductase
MYLHAGFSLPGPEYYDSWDLTENGVGAISRFTEAYEEGLPEVPRLEGRRIRILSGHSMSPFLEELIPSLRGATGAAVQVHRVTNEFFGESVTVAGLLSGQDLLRTVQDPEPTDLILVPGEALNADDLFIDSMPLGSLQEALAPAQVAAGLDITEILRVL